MKTIALVLLLIGSAVSTSCDSTSPGDDTTIQALFPLKVGNKWTMLANEYYPDGSIRSEDTLILSVDSAGTAGGHSGFYLSGPESIFFYYSGSDIISYDVQYGDSRTIIRYPIGNTEVIIHDTLYADNYRSQTTLKLVSQNASIAVPAGTFSCHSFETISKYGLNGALDTTGMSTFYLANGIGLIQENDYSFNAGVKYMRSSLKLMSYVVK